MKFFSNRRSAKYHAALAALTEDGAVRPVPAAEQAAQVDTSLFPYAETAQLTKTFLGRYISQEVTDDKLLTVIADHGCKEVAFAACAMFISIKTIRGFLQGEFAKGADRTEIVEPYLQCFVAAAYLKPTTFVLKDRIFATVLVTVAGDGRTPKEATLHALFSAWRAGPPEDAVLRERALSLSATVLHNASLQLDRMATNKAWREAAQYRRPLLQLEDVLKPAGKEFEGCVRAFLKRWRAWVAWDWEHKTSQKTVEGRFKWLWELWGPDLDAGEVLEEAMGCLWKGFVQRGGLPEWLKKTGIEFGPGVRRRSATESALTETMEHLERAIDVALVDGETSLRLLEMYVERNGLDLWSMETWKTARRLLVRPSPRFADYLVVPTASLDHVEDLDNYVLTMLDVLKGDEYANVRTPIVPEIARCVDLAYKNVEGKLREGLGRLDMDFDWLAPAFRLWRLRETVGKAGWLVDAVDPNVKTKAAVQASVKHLQVLKELHVCLKAFGNSSLLEMVEEYIRCYVFEGALQNQQPIQALHLQWILCAERTMREASIALAMLENVEVEIRCSCIDALQKVPESKASGLSDRLWSIQGKGKAKGKGKVTSAYLDLTDVIASLTGTFLIEPCWPALLWALLKADRVFIDQHEFTDRNFQAYRQWIKQLHGLFGDKLELVGVVHEWLIALEDMGMDSVLQAIETMEGGKPIMHRFITTTKRELATWLLKVLQEMLGEQSRLLEDEDPDRFNFMLALLPHLNESNGRKIYQSIVAANNLDDGGFQRVNRFLELAQKNKELARVKREVWSNMSEVSPATKAALVQVSELIGLQENHIAWSAAKKDFDGRVDELLDRAKALERTRMALLRSRRAEAEDMVADLGLEVPEGVAALLEDLPSELADVVQDVAEDQLELHFSLSHLHSLTKLALGVQGTETVVVTLRMYAGGIVDAFTVQLEEMVSTSRPAQDWISVNAEQAVLSLPTAHSGRRPTRLAHVVARTVWRELIAGEYDIETLYTRVKWTIQNGATECLVCAKDIGARLHRATCCGSMLCNLSASGTDLATQTEMVRLDTRVMDLLLTAVFAVAKTNNLDLLPGTPAALSYPIKMLGMLNALPATEELAKAADIQASLRQVGKHAALLMSWLCNASRNYIISASGDWRIPNMPGIHQFLVVDNPPQIEAAFAKHNHLQPRMVLFHGTSMDRLYAILAQGLKVLSNTPLMKHGAVSGPGIYFSTETALPISYASGAVKAAGQPAFFRSRRDFDGPQVLLGCEHAGPASRNGVYVVTDPSKVIVRYVFLVPTGVAVPLAKDIVSPMISTFYSLRASAAVNK